MDIDLVILAELFLTDFPILGGDSSGGGPTFITWGGATLFSSGSTILLALHLELEPLLACLGGVPTFATPSSATTSA
ncbi:hypothetical protein FRX31_011233, partial [Thalictrum thalictroides]